MVHYSCKSPWRMLLSTNLECGSIHICCSSLMNGWADFDFKVIYTFSFSSSVHSASKDICHLVWVWFVRDSLFSFRTISAQYLPVLGWRLDLERCRVRVSDYTLSTALPHPLTWISVHGESSRRTLYCQTSWNAATLSGWNWLPFPCPRHLTGNLQWALNARGT